MQLFNIQIWSQIQQEPYEANSIGERVGFRDWFQYSSPISYLLDLSLHAICNMKG